MRPFSQLVCRHDDFMAAALGWGRVGEPKLGRTAGRIRNGVSETGAEDSAHTYWCTLVHTGGLDAMSFMGKKAW